MFKTQILPVPENWPVHSSFPAESYADVEYWPRISIITPSYNQGSYIEDTILSVLNQNYPNLEFIIIDGGSSDQTVSILKKYSAQIDFWVSEKDQGQSDAINKGFSRATGEIINWLCSDDLLMPGALFQIAQAFRNKDINMVCGWSRQFADTKDLGLSCTTLYKSLPELLHQTHICQPATWFRKKLTDEFGPLNPGLHFAMDSEWFLHYLLKYGTSGIAEIPFVLCAYRYHDQSKTVSQDFRFREDKIGLIYPVLHLLQAPAFLQKFYKPFNRSVLTERISANKISQDLNVKEIFRYYTLQTITFSKTQKRYDIFILALLYFIALNPFMSLSEYSVLLKKHIAPKFFR